MRDNTRLSVLVCAAVLSAAACDSKTPAIGSFQSPTHGAIDDVVVVDGHAYLAEEDFGVRVLDVRDPRNMRQQGSLQLPGVDATGGARLAVSGNHLYVGSHQGCLDVVDVSNPAAPAKVGSFAPLACWGGGVFISGSTLYLADSVNGLWILDITTPTSPTLLGAYSPGGLDQCADVWVNGSTAYVVSSVGSLRILDISRPGLPTEIGRVVLPGYVAHSLLLDGSTVWVANGIMTLAAFSVTTSSSPTLISKYRGNEAYDAADVEMGQGATMFVADRGETDPGVWRMDVSNPAAPTVMTRFSVQGGSSCLAVVGNRVYTGDRFGNLWVADF